MIFMLVLLLALMALFLIAFLAGLLEKLPSRSHDGQDRPEASPSARQGRPPGCCGLHEVCEKEALMVAAGKEAEYYDDEELDAFRGRSSDSYTPEEEEQFEEVLTTMREEEVAGWLSSLRRRGINLPMSLRDEVAMFF